MTEAMQLEQLVVGAVATNCYIGIHTKTKEAFIVDPGGDFPSIKNIIEKNGAKPVAILLTHGHFDHVEAAEQLAETYKIPMIAHEKEKETLENAMINLSGAMMGNPQKFKADQYVKDAYESDVAGFHFRVLFTPGHTAGGCCYYFPREDMVFSGDSLFCGSIGRTDFPGGSASVLVGAIKDKLLQLPEQTLVLPGHDARTTIEQERMYNPFLSGVF